MSLVEQVRADTVAAMKAGDRERAGALRLVSAELQRALKEGPEEGVDESAVLRRERKRRVEAAEAYRQGGREDLAESEEREAAIIEGYLPAELGDEELDSIVGDAVAESGATSPAEMGKVMAVVMGRVDGRADGRRVSTLVREKLSA